jgi:hypothetical protein
LALHPPVEINIPLPINIQFSESLDVIKTVFSYYNPYYRGGLLGLCGINPIINSFKHIAKRVNMERFMNSFSRSKGEITKNNTFA